MNVESITISNSAVEETMIDQLNQMGISKLKEGSESEAAKYFYRALVECLSHEATASSTSSSNSLSLMSTWDAIKPSRQQQQQPSVTSRMEIQPLPSHLAATPTSDGVEATSSSPCTSDPNPNNVDEGMDIYRDAISLTENELVSCTSPRTTLAASILHYNMAQVFLRCGRFATAQKWLDRALVIYSDGSSNSSSININVADKDSSASSANDHMVQFRLWHALAYCLYRQGQAPKALSVYQKAMGFAQRHEMAAEHVAATQNCLGVVLFLHAHTSNSNGQEVVENAPASTTASLLEAALTLWHSAVTLYERVYGSDSSRIAAVLNNIGRAYCYQANYRLALPMYERAWAIRRMHHKPTRLFSDDNNLDNDDDLRSSFGSTSSNGSSSTTGSSSSSSSPSPSTLDLAASVCNLAQTYHHCGDLDLALLHYFEFLELVESPSCSSSSRGSDNDDDTVSRNHSLPHHRDMAVIYTYMAEIHIHQGDLEEAKSCYRNALTISQNVLGESTPHHDLALLLYKMGNVHYQLEEFNDALSCYNQGLYMDQAVLGWNDPQISVGLLNVAQIQRVLRQYGDAMITYCRLHSIQIATHGIDSLEVSATLSVMGLLQYQTKNYASSFDLYLQALQIQRSHYGENNDQNCDIAWTMSSLGLVLFHQGAFTLSKRCFSDSLRMRQQILGPDHAENAVLCYNLATICLKDGDEESALEYYKETIRIERIHAMAVAEAPTDSQEATTLPSKPDGHALTSTDESNENLFALHLGHLAILYQRRGEFDAAIECYTEAIEFEQSSNKPDAKDGTTSARAVGRLHNLIGNLYLQTGQVELMMQHYGQASRVFQSASTTSNGESEAVDMVGFNLYLLSKLLPPCAAVA